MISECISEKVVNKEHTNAYMPNEPSEIPVHRWYMWLVKDQMNFQMNILVDLDICTCFRECAEQDHMRV